VTKERSHRYPEVVQMAAFVVADPLVHVDRLQVVVRMGVEWFDSVVERMPMEVFR